MLRYVSFNELEQKHLDYLAASMLAAPEESRLDPADILRGLQQETMRLFDCGEGCVVVARSENRLQMYAFASRGLHTIIKSIVDDLRRLAADWECDMIETTVFDPRLTSVIQKIGGRVESVNMLLSVEPGNG